MALGVVASAVGAATPGARPLSFNRDIRPILSENCFQCHGPDQHKRKAELRLDVRADAVEALAIVPGDPAQSDAIRRIFEHDEDEVMPPPASRRTLTDAQKQILKRWVAEGAAYEAHWAYTPPVRPAVPASKLKPFSPNPIDAFIGTALERERLKPASEADRRTLIRRLSLDLTGLPPAPAEVDAFVASRDPRAYEQLVARLLASPRFGERLAVPWLDLVRYADSIGFHNDVPIRAWPYRDYVIDAFNRNLPFDQFTREQLAGDLLPGSTMQQRVGSGYNRLHRISGEGGIQDKEYSAKYSADRVRTTATVWLGSTLACAECHDHKYDPFTTKDFYRFAAIFADLKEKGAYNLSGGFTRENLTEETIFENPAQQQQLEGLTVAAARTEAALKAITDEQIADGRAAWVDELARRAQGGVLAWTVQHPLRVTSPVGTPFTISAEDHSVSPGGRNPANDTYVVTVPATLERITALRLETVVDPLFPGNEIARAGMGFFISELEVNAQRPGLAPERIALANARTNGTTEPGFPAAALIDGDPQTAGSLGRKTGGGIAVDFATPWSGAPGATLTLTIKHSARHPYQQLGRFRIALHTQPLPDPNADGAPEAILKAIKVAPAERTAAQQKDLASYYRLQAPELAAARAAWEAAVLARDRMLLALPSLPVSRSVEPRPIRVLPRCNWMDDSGEHVEAGVPAFLGSVTPRDGKRVSRLDLAEWLVSPANPLTARTFVNRLWRIYFGTGLTRTLEDLGSQGEWPTHPELLDWLAVEFRESGWNVKHLVELIVTSRTYRQSTQGSAAALERDPENRLLARQSRPRLEAEFVRDNALAISGLLVASLGGPAAKPYQPEGYYAPMNFPKREYAADVGEGLYRRGVYTHWQRTLLLPSFVAFDAPARDECTANRSTSNTPLQALVLLNDPTYVEAARVLAERTLREGGAAPRAKLDWMFTRALARPAARAEAKVLTTLLEQQLTRYQRDEAAAREVLAVGATPAGKDRPPAEIAAWTAVARAVLNLHETITRP